MSTFNTNYAPPAVNANQPINLVNGATMQGAGVPSPTPPQQQQQYQQQQQQQQQYQQQQQQQLRHQQILQQKQQPPQQQQQQQPIQTVPVPQQQQHSISGVQAPPKFNSNFINNYVPPASSSSAAAMPSSTGLSSSSINGPLRGPPGSGVQNPISNLPPHLRPQQTTFNGPPSAAAVAGQPPPPAHVNGGSELASANSSRTASPALHTLPPQIGGNSIGLGATTQPTSQTINKPPQTMFVAPNQNQSTLSNASNLANNMQTLNLGSRAGNEQPKTEPPRLTSGGNVQASFRPLTVTGPSPSRTDDVYRTPSLGSEASVATRCSDITTPSILGNEVRPNLLQSPKDVIFPSVVPVNRNPASIFGCQVAPSVVPGLNPQLVYGGRSPHSSGVAQENQSNNNKQGQMMPPMTNQPGPPGVYGPPTTSQALATQTLSMAPTSQRKPMYPTSAQLPPVAGQPPPQQQQQHLQQKQQQLQQPNQQMYQQQSPYGQAYQQPPQAPAHFQQHPGQSYARPLQYQSQPPPPQSGVLPPQAQPQPQLQPNPQAFNAPNVAAPYNSSQMSVTNQGFSRLWGQDTMDLMQNRHILSPATVPPPKIVLHNQFHESINCSPSIMRCTLAKIPESNSLLQKSRLPLGILIHPFRDINSLPVIQCPNIVRCRLCRTYINPFVYFVDSKVWKCNLCYRVNELPEDFQFDPATKTYGDVTRRPEVRSSTIEFIAPSEYMLRPPQPAIYLFLFDVSIISQQSGYLETACAVLSKHLDDMPGDARTQVGFITFDSHVHFYSMAEGFNQPHEMTLVDIEDPFLPRPDSLLVNLKECKELIKDLLTQLPKRFSNTHDPGSALGAALQVAFKLMQSSGGRITVFQTCLPNRGPGALEAREDPNNRSAKDIAHLNPATDFYKRYALECSGYQIAVDLFLMNQQYSDIATVSGISKYSGGCVHHFPLYQNSKPQHVDSFKHCFKRYLTRKIGFEAVMRIRCTRGLQVHTFHGNFFVRSTDLLSLPNVNPDAGYGMQISYEESLLDVKTICFQAALLYTNSEGERRIRVHTLCLPVTSSLPEVMHAADTEAIIGLLSKMAVDRSVTSNVSDAREAFINATVDVFNAFKIAQNLPSGQNGQLIAPRSLALMPLYILALLKHPAFRVGTSTRLDDRVYAMDCMKTLPLDQLMKFIYPEFYKLDVLFYNVQNSNQDSNDDDELPDVPRLQLSAEYLDSRSMFLIDCGTQVLIYVGLNVPAKLLENTLGITSTAALPDYYYGLPHVNSTENDTLRRFIAHLNEEKPFSPLIQIIRDTSTAKPQVIEKLVDDRSESSLSYYEFLQHIRSQVK